MNTRIGICIGRRASACVVVGLSRKRSDILFHDSFPRAKQAGAVEALRTALNGLPPRFRKVPVGLALSSSLLACDDTWVLPDAMAKSIRPRMAAVLAEVRSLGASAEALAVDSLITQRRVTVLSIERPIRTELIKASSEAGFELTHASGIPLALAGAYDHAGRIEYTWAGDTVVVERSEGELVWRSYPSDSRPETFSEPTWHGHPVTPALAGALAATGLDADHGLNLLADHSLSGRSWRKLESSVAALAVSAAFLFAVLGFHFQRVSDDAQAALTQLAVRERPLRAQYLSDEKPSADLLRLLRMRARLGAGDAGDSFPSALAMWDELGKHLPDPNQVGLTLESLDLGQDGGRLVARLPASGSDPLKNAYQLENQLLKSTCLGVRGDYESRGKEIQVRLRIDYKGH